MSKRRYTDGVGVGVDGEEPIAGPSKRFRTTESVEDFDDAVVVVVPHHQPSQTAHERYTPAPAPASQTQTQTQTHTQTQTRTRTQATTNGHPRDPVTTPRRDPKGKRRARTRERERDESAALSQDDDERIDEGTADFGASKAGWDRNPNGLSTGAGANVEETQTQTQEEELAEYEDRFRTLLEGRRKRQGTVAETGVIEHVEMYNFMCHKALKFDLGSQVNFIIGHNGSGKSAILSAITIALGGKTGSTGRGTGLKGFIREGQSTAEITIHLKNRGDEAYEPHKYGDTIVITREIRKEGQPKWKIRTKDRVVGGKLVKGKLVSDRKEEVSAICDHMNIQVDNPLSVLTQDAARMFLSNAKPTVMYDFFERGTLLQQLSTDYSVCMANNSLTAKLINHNRAALPDLKARHREAVARYDDASEARKQHQKVEELQQELTWALVAEKRDELADKVEQAAMYERRLPRIERELDGAKAELGGAAERVERAKEEMREVGSSQELDRRVREIKDAMSVKKHEIMDLNRDIKQINASLTSVNDTIHELTQKILTETHRMEQSTQGKRLAAQLQISDTKARIDALTSTRLPALHASRSELTREAGAARAACEDLLRRAEDEKRHAQSCESMVVTARQAEGDVFLPYGRAIQSVLTRLGGMRWYGDVPLGPLGMYVQAKDPERWGEVLRTQLRQFLVGFAVTDARDRPVLKRVLAEFGNPTTPILIYEKDLFDFSAGEPPAHLLTVHRALTVSDPYVLRILVNQARIERQILAASRREAEDSLRALRGGGVAWTLDGFVVRVYAEGGISNVPIPTRTTNDVSNLLLTGRNTAGDVRHYTELQHRHEAERAALVGEWQRRKEGYEGMMRRVAEMDAEEKRYTHELRQCQQRLGMLAQEAAEDLPDGVAGLEGAREDAEKEKENLKAQFKDVFERKAALDSAQAERLTELNALKVRISEFDGKKREKNDKIDKAVEEETKAAGNVRYYEKKYQEEKAKADKVQEEAEVLQLEFTNWTAKAAEICEEWPNPRRKDEVRRILHSVQKALKERAKAQGASVEELAQEVVKTENVLLRTRHLLKQLSRLHKSLSVSLHLRLNRWHAFQQVLALRCKVIFGFHMSQRGYFGKLIFDHQAKTLQLRVQTDDQMQTQTQMQMQTQRLKDKDPKSLSGGEKSFSTICLLLSLWDSIGCPLRCLDEFDVFMDAVNRRISMKMMIDTATTSDKKQYILITPQDMGNVRINPSVKVHRMADPERGQTQLNFASASGES